MATSKLATSKLAWAISGSGHYFVESLEILKKLSAVQQTDKSGLNNAQAGFDLFVSKAAQEVVAMYRQKLDFGLDMAAPDAEGGSYKTRIFKDTTASAPAVGKFYQGEYHGLVLAPATSNTIAKCVYGISDNLVTNVFAQAGKCRVPIIVFACDTAPEMESEAPGGLVKLWPRKIDLDNVEKLKSFENTVVVSSLAELSQALEQHYARLAQHFRN
ncbi:MAG: flavoprotein [Alphaproteobacteria bacterium]|nr:flavoprotein [Alphaproteobacteria bacterium]